jgi:CBS domain-containing protein
MNVASILARKGGKVVTCRPAQSIRQALALLAEHNVGALVVVDDRGLPSGILSERDVVREAARDERLFARTIGEIMTRDVVVAVPEDDLASVRHTMTERRIRHLPVIAEGRLCGIVSIGDVVKAERDQYLGEIDTLQMQVAAGPP